MGLSGSAHDLGHVFWLGGSPCAGKSSVSEILAERFDLRLYPVDEAFEAHARRFDPVLHPTLTKWCESSWDERWMRPVESLVRDVIACYREHFTLILEDILSLPGGEPVLVEGTALLPRQVSGVLADRNRAVWLVPIAEFQRKHYSKRDWVCRILEQCDSREAAFHNWMERDAEFARWVALEVDELGLELLQVDGKHTVEENAAKVASYFQLSADALRV